MKHSMFFYLSRPKAYIRKLCVKLSESYALKEQWKHHMNYPLNLSNPQTLCEKLQWLKLYDRNPLYHQLVDKYEVKAIVDKKLGKGHTAECYGVYNSVDEIHLDKLPNRFVLKCTHDSGSFAICKDKSTFDFKHAKEILQAGLNNTSYYNMFFEWAYKDVPPRIIAEEYIDSLGKPESVEYKITCMNGKVKMITICSGIPHSDFDKRFNDHFTPEGKRLPFVAYYQPAGKELPSAELKAELIRLSEILAENIPYVRVDWYVHEGKIFFGEMTFYTWAGYMDIQPKEYDSLLGSWLQLPQKRKE